MEVNKPVIHPVQTAKTVTLTKDVAEIRFPYDPGLVMAVKEIPGRKWESNRKIWTIPLTTDALAKLKEFVEQYRFDGDTQAINDLADKATQLAQESIEASKAASAEIEVEGLGGTLRPFQKAGVKYAVEKKRVLIGDQPGLGKTMEALASVQALNAYPVLIIVPATLKWNWYNHTRNWLPGKTIQVFGTETVGRADANLTIINYDQLKRYRDYLVQRDFKAVICDESHLLKSAKSQRTQFVEEIINGCIYGRTEKGRLDRRNKEQLRKPVDVRLLLSGTPLLNRPAELVSQLQILDRLREFGGWYGFMREFCDLSYNRFGMDISGAKNLKTLNDRLRASTYIRRLKSEVLKELPPKQRTVVPVEITNRVEYNRAERDLIAWLRETQGAEKANAAARAEQLVRIEALKQLVARGMLPAIKEWVEDFLDTSEKLVVFCFHHEIIDALIEELNGSGLDWSKIQSLDGNSASGTPLLPAQPVEKTDVAMQMLVWNSQGGRRIDSESRQIKGVHNLPRKEARSVSISCVSAMCEGKGASEESRNTVHSEMAKRDNSEEMPDIGNSTGVQSWTRLPMGNGTVFGPYQPKGRIHARKHMGHQLASEPTEERRNPRRTEIDRQSTNASIAVQVDGRIPLAARQEAVSRFQNDPTCRVIVLQLQTGGLGLTLTAASNVLFCELGWNPGTMNQASDRCHRIGQTDNVMEWWFIGQRTIDEKIQQLIEAKRAVVDTATDGKEQTEEVSVMNELVAWLREDGQASEAGMK